MESFPARLIKIIVINKNAVLRSSTKAMGYGKLLLDGAGHWLEACSDYDMKGLVFAICNGLFLSANRNLGRIIIGTDPSEAARMLKLSSVEIFYFTRVPEDYVSPTWYPPVSYMVLESEFVRKEKFRVNL